MPENISFNEIPVDIRTSGQYIEIDNSKAVQGLPNQVRRVLIMTQKLAAGTGVAATPYRITQTDQAEQLFGRGSLGHLMCRAAKVATPYTDLWAIALDDNVAGVAAIGSLTFGGAPTASATLNLYLGGQQVQIAIASGEASSVSATNLAAKINLITDLPVTAAVDGVDDKKVNITARNKGECGNDIDIRVNYYQGEFLPNDLTATIVAMTGGTGNPAIATAITAIDGEQYHTLISAWNDAANIAALETELTSRFGPMNPISGHAYAGFKGTHAAASTYGSARNSAHTTIIPMDASPTPSWLLASVWGNIAEFNYAIDPARPLQTLNLPGILPPIEEKRWSQPERNLLLKDGMSTWRVDQGGNVYIERCVTTYQTNAFGVEDISYLDVNTVETNNYLRFVVTARIALRFPRYKLADDGTSYAPGQAIVTPKVIRAELIALFRELEYVGLVENFDQFKNDLLVVRSDADMNRVNCIFPPNIINQFRVFAAAVQFRL